MPYDTETVPRGLDAGLDKLLDERSRLFEQRREAWQAVEAAEAAVRPAKRADREAYAAALRKDGAKDPGTKNTDAAKATAEAAQRKLDAVKEAITANELDVLEFLDERRSDLIEKAAAMEEDHRTAGLEALQQVSERLPTFARTVAFRSWLEQPMTPAGGELRPFTVKPMHVSTARIHRSSEHRSNVQVLIDCLAERLETAGTLDLELARVCRAAGLEVESVERRDGGGMRLGRSPKVTVLDIGKLGLTRFIFTRRGKATQMPVAIATLDSMELADFIARCVQPVNRAFVANQLVADPVDDETRQIVAGLVTDLSPQREPLPRRLTVTDMDELRAQREPEPAAAST